MKKFNFIDRENRPWGSFYVIHEEEDYKLKRLEIDPNKRLSYQFHNKRSETWVIIRGSALITIDDITKPYDKGDTIVIPVGTKHRIENKDKETVVLIEIQTGSYFGEDDITRIEDDYNRK
jgi:mannose-6-phosphate isomerase